MKQFRPYPIYINHNPFTETERQEAYQVRELDYLFETDRKQKEAYRKQMQEEKKRYGKFTDYKAAERWKSVDTVDKDRETFSVEDSPSPESITFENALFDQLKFIYKTVIGKLLFDSLNPNVKVWILPMNDLVSKACGCAAATLGLYPSPPGEGIRIYYDSPSLDDDTLFHELVHAYRTGTVSPGKKQTQPLREYMSAEEFLAVHLQNIYRACRGNVNFRRSHLKTTLLTKDELYNYLSSDLEAISSLKYFRNNDPLAATVAKWAYPFCNPWRDFPTLEKIFLSRNPVINGKVRTIPPIW